jgi:hypothetical protein
MTREMFELRSNDFKKRRWRFTASEPPITELFGLHGVHKNFGGNIHEMAPHARSAAPDRILRRIMLHEM